MSKSASLRAAEWRALFHLVGECRDLGDDSAAWGGHLAAGLSRLAGPSLVLVAELGGVAVRKPFLAGVETGGWENGFNRARLQAALAEFRADPFYAPPVNAYLSRMAAERSPALARGDLLLDSDWYRSAYFQNFHHHIGADDVMFCIRPVGTGGDPSLGLELLRGCRDRPYTARQKAAIREVGTLVAPLLGGPLARFEEPRPGDLPPRVRQVLTCFLDGDSDKQAAARLGISRHTVNEYAKQINRHFGVTGRAELLARWVRRGWGAAGGWVNPAT